MDCSLLDHIPGAAEGAEDIGYFTAPSFATISFVDNYMAFLKKQQMELKCSPVKLASISLRVSTFVIFCCTSSEFI